MKQITTITTLVLVFLYVLFTSRLSDAPVSHLANRIKSDQGLDSTRVEKEKLRSKASPQDSLGKAGGIWFW